MLRGAAPRQRQAPQRARLRAMSTARASWRTWSRAGGRLDPDVMLPRAAVHRRARVDAGPRFTVPLRDRRGRRRWTWRCATASRSGEPSRATRAGARRDRAGLARQLPAHGHRRRSRRPRRCSSSCTVDGELYPVTLLGRWIDRAAGPRRRRAAPRGQRSASCSAREGLWSVTGAGARRATRATPTPEHGAAARLPPALRALGAPELECARARLLRRPASTGWPRRRPRRRTRSGGSARSTWARSA